MTEELAELLRSDAWTGAGTRDAEDLSEWLYRHCYIKRFDDATASHLPGDLIPALSAANPCVDRVHDGWIAKQVLSGGSVLAQRGGILRTFAPGEFLAPGRGMDSAVEKGDPIQVLTWRESLRRQEGMYYLLGETLDLCENDGPILRFYWNVIPQGAPALFRAVAAELNRFGVPFRMKCPADANQFPRRDAAVLYLAARYRDIIGKLVLRIHADLDPATLQASTPLFCRTLAPGLGFAEDPGNDLSFGQHRCKLLAEALVNGNTVESVFEREGLSLERPWLNPNSEDLALPQSAVTAGPRSYKGSYLETAARIGGQLCRDAIWCGGLCTWLADDRDEDESIRHSPIGSELYLGAAGIALFLSRLAKQTCDRIFADTAHGAIRYAQSKSDPSTPVGGLYGGYPGVLLALAEVLQEPVAESALASLAGKQLAGAMHDVMHGAAGMIAALLSAWRKSGNSALLDAAIPNGDWLIAEAERMEAGGISWKTGENPRNLTGFSHGAAGIGWALSELYAASKQQRFADAALDAFRYERSCFNAEEQNWPDFRAEEEIGFPVAWCHGAPGILLSRIRAAAIFPSDAEIREEVQIAAETTRNSPLSNWCLCHGQAGNAEALLLAGFREDAIRIAEEGIERYGRKLTPWPVAIEEHGPELPGLMTGLAGVGHFYLRLHAEHEVPSPLLWL